MQVYRIKTKHLNMKYLNELVEEFNITNKPDNLEELLIKAKNDLNKLAKD